VTIARRTALALGLLAIAAMGAVPPWVTAPVAHPSATTSVGYRFFFAAPSVPTGTTVWSSKHQRFERDGQPLPDGWAKVLAPPYAVGPQPMVIDYGGILMPGFVRIDFARLFVQWVVAAALVGVVLLFPLGGRPRS